MVNAGHDIVNDGQCHSWCNDDLNADGATHDHGSVYI